jgi:hypothetical protein
MYEHITTGSHDTPHRASPRPRIDAIPTGRVPLSPRERALLTALKTRLREMGISATEAGRRAGIDPGDARRALSLTPNASATPRTLNRLFDTFNVSEFKDLSAAERREALLLEGRASAEKLAHVLGDLAAMAAADPPEF